MKRIGSIVKKDLTQIFRNRFIAVISFLLIIIYGTIYSLMPSKIDETFKLGFFIEVEESVAKRLPFKISQQEIEKRLTESQEERKGAQGVRLIWTKTEGELKNKVEEEDVSAGIAFSLKEPVPEVILYVSSKTPEEIIEAGEVVGKEIAYALVGYELPADLEISIIGVDLVGKQIPVRDKLRVLFLSLVFLLELYGLGNLIMEEVQKKTVNAVLVTPVTLAEFVSAKASTGLIMAFSQGLLLAILIRAIDAQTWLPLIVFLLLGGALIVGLSFILGALSRDFINLMMVSLIPFMIMFFPGLVVLDPGLDSPVIKAIPTYFLIQPINEILNYGKGMLDLTVPALALLIYSVAFFVIGFLILKRRVR